MAKKAKRQSTPASTHFPTLRQAAALYYNNPGDPPLPGGKPPWAKPAPPKTRDRKHSRPKVK
jgi:hypothetical protein